MRNTFLEAEHRSSTFIGSYRYNNKQIRLLPRFVSRKFSHKKNLLFSKVLLKVPQYSYQLDPIGKLQGRNSFTPIREFKEKKQDLPLKKLGGKNGNKSRQFKGRLHLRNPTTRPQMLGRSTTDSTLPW